MSRLSSIGYLAAAERAGCDAVRRPRENTADCVAFAIIMRATPREDHHDFSPDAQTHARIGGGQ